MLNKKAIVEDVLPLILTILFLFVIFLLFSITKGCRSDIIEESTQSEILYEDSTQLLVNFLKSPLDTDYNPEGNTAEAINIYFLIKDENILKKINLNAEEFLSKSHLVTDHTYWELTIEYPGERNLIIRPEISNNYILVRPIISRQIISSAIIPSHSSDKSVEIILFQTIIQ